MARATSDGSRSRECPRCGGSRTLRIVYGYPSAGLEADADAGRVELGGCDVDGSEPTRRCRDCGHAWRPRRPDEDPLRPR